MQVLLTIFVGMGIVFVAFATPVFGFAGLSAAIAFWLYMVGDFRRIPIERPFFIREGGLDIAAPMFALFAVINAFGRALAVGAAALFTFPLQGLDKVPSFIQFDFQDYSRQLEAERFVTFALFGGTLVIALIIGGVLAGSIRGIAHRWALYRMGVVLGVIYSAGALMVHHASPRIEAWLGEDRLPGTASYYDPPTVTVFADAFHQLKDTLSDTAAMRRRQAAREANCRPEIIAKLPDRGWFVLTKDEHRRRYGCDKPEDAFAVDPRETVDVILLTVSVFDDFVDNLIADAVGNASGTALPIPREVAKPAATVVLSSNLLQGFVISTYAGLFLTLVGRRRH